jgi:hypothetical protein
MRYKPNQIKNSAGIRSNGKENSPATTVEGLKIKKLKESAPHTTKNRNIISA